MGLPEPEGFDEGDQTVCVIARVKEVLRRIRGLATARHVPCHDGELIGQAL